MEEASSSSSELLEPRAQPASRVSRATVMGAVLGVVGVVAVATAAYSRPSFMQQNDIIELAASNASDDIWAAVLDDSAYQAFEASTTTTEEPTTAAPTEAPSTAAPTEAPSTAEPTTAEPTTAEPTTLAPVVVTTTVTTAPLTTPEPVDATAVSVTVNAAAVDTSSTYSTVATLAAQFLAQAQSLPVGSAHYTQAMTMYNKLQEKLIALSTTAAPLTSAAPVVPAATAATQTSTTEDPGDSPLAPKETVGDGNPCNDDEESVSNVCYKKCADLTGGSHPIRTSPFSCCAAQPCTSSNTWTHFGMCSGYDIAGDAEASTNGKCPTTPGACLTNEEMFGDMCYLKCSDLTNGQYPHRSAAMSCCKTTGIGCFIFSNVQTDASYGNGGGAGDGNSGTPSSGHPPLTGVTTD